MTHKEKMDWLKENDPMTYYEMNSNPTGTNSDTSLAGFIIFILTVLGVSTLIIVAS